MKSTKPVIIIGSGGHASVLLDILLSQGIEVIAVSSNEAVIERRIFSGINHLRGNEAIYDFSPDDVILVNGVGSMPNNDIRATIHRNFIDKGYRFLTVIAGSAIVSEYANIGEGCQILHKAVVQPGTQLSACSIVNTAASVDHDCHIGFNNHIAPGATLSGQVITGDNVHVGTGANIIHCIKIGEQTVIGAGAAVTKDIEANQIVYPAKNFIQTRK